MKLMVDLGYQQIRGGDGAYYLNHLFRQSRSGYIVSRHAKIPGNLGLRKRSMAEMAWHVGVTTSSIVKAVARLEEEG